MTRDKMNEMMMYRTIGEMRRIERRRRLEWDGCWPILIPAGRTWCVSSVYDSADVESAGPDLVPVEIVGTGATLRIRRCDPDHGCDAYVRTSVALAHLPRRRRGGA